MKRMMKMKVKGILCLLLSLTMLFGMTMSVQAEAFSKVTSVDGDEDADYILAWVSPYTGLFNAQYYDPDGAENYPL